MCDGFVSTLEQIIFLMKEAGYDPYTQIHGYLITGEDFYITRTGGARNMIGSLDKGKLRRYIDEKGFLIK